MPGVLRLRKPELAHRSLQPSWKAGIIIIPFILCMKKRNTQMSQEIDKIAQRKGLDSRLELRSSESNRWRTCLRPLLSQVLFILRAWHWLRIHIRAVQKCACMCVCMHMYFPDIQKLVSGSQTCLTPRKKHKVSHITFGPTPQSPKWKSPYRPHPLCVTSCRECSVAPTSGWGVYEPPSLHQLGPLVTGHWGKPPGLSRDVGSHGGQSSFLTHHNYP